MQLNQLTSFSNQQTGLREMYDMLGVKVANHPNLKKNYYAR